MTLENKAQEEEWEKMRKVNGEREIRIDTMQGGKRRVEENSK